MDFAVGAFLGARRLGMLGMLGLPLLPLLPFLPSSLILAMACNDQGGAGVPIVWLAQAPRKRVFPMLLPLGPLMLLPRS